MFLVLVAVPVCLRAEVTVFLSAVCTLGVQCTVPDLFSTLVPKKIINKKRYKCLWSTLFFFVNIQSQVQTKKSCYSHEVKLTCWEIDSKISYSHQRMFLTPFYYFVPHSSLFDFILFVTKKKKNPTFLLEIDTGPMCTLY